MDVFFLWWQHVSLEGCVSLFGRLYLHTVTAFSGGNIVITIGGHRGEATGKISVQRSIWRENHLTHYCWIDSFWSAFFGGCPQHFWAHRGRYSQEKGATNVDCHLQVKLLKYFVCHQYIAAIVIADLMSYFNCKHCYWCYSHSGLTIV